MTAAEYLEYVQEAMSFPPDGIGRDPDHLLYATEAQCEELRDAHQAYVRRVADILNLDLLTPTQEEPTFGG